MRPGEESEPLGGARTFLNSDPGRAREKAEIYFYSSEGRLGPPHVYMRGPVRARARARAKYKQENKNLLTASSFRTENANPKNLKKKI